MTSCALMVSYNGTNSPCIPSRWSLLSFIGCVLQPHGHAINWFAQLWRLVAICWSIWISFFIKPWTPHFPSSYVSSSNCAMCWLDIVRNLSVRHFNDGSGWIATNGCHWIRPNDGFVRTHHQRVRRAGQTCCRCSNPCWILKPVSWTNCCKISCNHLQCMAPSTHSRMMICFLVKWAILKVWGSVSALVSCCCFWSPSLEYGWHETPAANVPDSPTSTIFMSVLSSAMLATHEGMPSIDCASSLIGLLQSIRRMTSNPDLSKPWPRHPRPAHTSTALHKCSALGVGIGITFVSSWITNCKKALFTIAWDDSTNAWMTR